MLLGNCAKAVRDSQLSTVVQYQTELNVLYNPPALYTKLTDNSALLIANFEASNLLAKCILL